ncbi:matrixin family metalloprotease [Amaricoccus sp.]|uniref:matrixin family metalloprotease n=1 Tax=Amaricoccus sp. TaxID=1872485 RepID=UPI001B76400A|nr:matrixin family metalloprotease [Amaricoccus sp.]MBP6999981.1 matrixin family metalloprotease [Amaricoccus sp.]
MSRPALSLALLLAIAGGAQAEEFRLLRLGGLYVKWASPALGAPASVSWGLAAAPEPSPDARNCRDLQPLGALPGVDPARLRAVAATAFAMWSRAAGIAFRPAPEGQRPDILIGAQPGMRRIAYADVRPDPAAAEGEVAPIARATICLDPEADWGGEFDLVTVLAHEIGHTIGLDHPGATGALMGYQNQGPLAALLPGDVAGARTLYGPPKTVTLARAN